MDLIEWREDFCTGISGVDYEHQQLIAGINSIYQLVDDEAEKTLIIETLGDIYGHISAHFALEEQMMERYDYDQTNEHKADHNRLLDEIVELTDKFESSSRFDDKQFKQALNDWFQNHFKTHDSRLHKLAEFMVHPKADKPRLLSMFKQARHRFFSHSKKRH